MWRTVPVLAFVLGAGFVIGAAASVTISTARVGANAIATPRCTSIGMPLVQNLTGTSVTSVTVSGIPSACGGATLYATANNGTTASSGSVAVPAGGGSATVTLSSGVPVATAVQVDVVVTGP
jgi:hypothetical protein